MLRAFKYANVMALKQIVPFIIVALMIQGVEMYRAPHPIESFSRWIWPRKVVAGQEVKGHATVYRRKGPCSSVVRSRFVDEGGRVLSERTFNVEPPSDNPEDYPIKLTIPVDALPGKLYYRVTANFRCNWIQKTLGGTDFPLPDVRFTVVPKED